MDSRFEVPAGHMTGFDEGGLLHYVWWGTYSVDTRWPWWRPGREWI